MGELSLLEAIEIIAKYNVEIKWQSEYWGTTGCFSYIPFYTHDHFEKFDEWSKDKDNTQSKLDALIRTANFWKQIKEGEKK